VHFATQKNSGLIPLLRARAAHDFLGGRKILRYLLTLGTPNKPERQMTTSNATMQKPQPRYIDTTGYGFNAATTAIIRKPANTK
jgi:hypothetical protein